MNEITTSMGSKTITTMTAMGFVHGPASLTSSTAQPGGVVQLVTPAQIQTNLSLGSNQLIGTIGRLAITFIPEPDLGILLAVGTFGLALLGRTRRRE
jgi:hypothetical protein